MWAGRSSILQITGQIVLVPPFFENFGKRLIKSPRLYFVDSGLLCSLLGIRKAAQLAEHPLRGAVFENWVMTEILKSRVHRGLPADLHFFRSRAGLEVDGSRYFWFHHTDADTVDKLDPVEMQKCVAALAVLAFVVADLPEKLPRK